MLNHFAVEYTPPAGTDEMFARWFWVVAFVGAVVFTVKQFLPRPPMEKQLEMLKDTLLKRLDEQDTKVMRRLEDQDEKADRRITQLREHFDDEVVRVHQRIDAQGKELYRLDGYVRGASDARREAK